jgi:bacterioferritin (cytochrome b1)
VLTQRAAGTGVAVSHDDPMEVQEAIAGLNDALRLQFRSVVQFALAAGSTLGLAHAFVADRLADFARAELEDARRVAEKIVALGGSPGSAVASVPSTGDPESNLAALITSEEEAVDAFRRVIRRTGNLGPGEALEHLLEHLILRKQEQLDFLARASGRAGRT